MNVQFKEKRFSVDIDKLLNGNSIEESKRAGDDYGKAEDDYGRMVDLAKAVASVDYSTDSKLRQGLLDRLLKQMSAQHRPGLAGANCGELDEDELAKVAGGQVLSGQEQGCSLCGCKLSAAGVKGDTCPDCGHSRGCHQ